MQAVQNFGLAAVSLMASDIVDRFGYFWLEMFFSTWAFVALLATAGLWMADSRSGGILNMSIGDRKRALLLGNKESKMRRKCSYQNMDCPD